MKLALARSGLSFACLLLAAGCHKNVSVGCLPEAPSIDNKEIANFGAIGAQKIGFINSTGSALGDVYQLSLTADKEIFANPDRSITYSQASASDFVKKDPANTYIDVAISWEFDAKAQSQLDASQQASIQASSAKTWSLDLENASQVSLKSSLDQINNDDRNKDLKAHILNNPNSIFMILNPALEGDSGELKVDQATQVKGSSSIKIGWLITANVNYSCTADLLRKKIGVAQPTLITYPELVKASDDHKTVVHSAGLTFPVSGTEHLASVGGDNHEVKRPKVPSYATLHFCKKSGNDAKDSGCIQ